MSEKKLYFIALVPKGHLQDKVWQLKEYFRDQYNSRKALNSPPHITLQMPFKWREDREKKVLTMLEKVASHHHSFQVNLDGYGFFEPRVVYIKCKENLELSDLHSEISSAVRQNLKIINELGERPFRPHMTIAFRDLRKDSFYRAKQEFENKSFNEVFEVTDITLLKHNGHNWDILSRIPFTRT